MRRTMRSVAAMAALALVIAACGSSDDDMDSGAAETPSEPSGGDTGGDAGGDAGGDSGGDETPFYEGKTITIIVPFSPGGGSDRTGRFVAQWLPEFVEGNPTVVVENVPGGGGSIAHNAYYRDGSNNGETLILASVTPHSLWMYGSATAEYDLRELIPIVSPSTGKIAYSRADLGFDDPTQIIESGATLHYPGDVPVGGSLLDVSGFQVLGVDLQETWGYESGGDAILAFERGEANVNVAVGLNYQNTISAQVEAGEVIPLFSYGQVEDGELVRDPAAPDLMTVAELHEALHGEPPSGDLWNAYMNQVALANTVGTPTYIHSDAPPEAVEALKAGVAAMVQDPAFLESAAELTGPYEWKVGDELEGAIQRWVYDVPQEEIDWLADYAMERYEVNLRE